MLRIDHNGNLCCYPNTLVISNLRCVVITCYKRSYVTDCCAGVRWCLCEAATVANPRQVQTKAINRYIKRGKSGTLATTANDPYFREQLDYFKQKFKEDSTTGYLPNTSIVAACVMHDDNTLTAFEICLAFILACNLQKQYNYMYITTTAASETYLRRLPQTNTLW